MDSSKEGIPRRLELDDEIIQYLQTLDGQITKNGIEESDKESIEILVNNVLSEIKNRCGSLASDRKTSLIIEKLVLLSDIPQIIEFCRKLSPYSLFLAKNRYSSHVLQVIFHKKIYINYICVDIFMYITFMLNTNILCIHFF